MCTRARGGAGAGIRPDLGLRVVAHTRGGGGGAAGEGDAVREPVEVLRRAGGVGADDVGVDEEEGECALGLARSWGGGECECLEEMERKAGRAAVRDAMRDVAPSKELFEMRDMTLGPLNGRGR